LVRLLIQLTQKSTVYFNFPLWRGIKGEDTYCTKIFSSNSQF